MMLCACKKEVEESILQAYDTHIALTDINTSAENVAVQFANYMRNAHYKAAYDLIVIPDGVFYTEEDMKNTQALEFEKLSSKDILTDVTASNNNAILTYSTKIGEAYTRVKRKTDVADYIGEVCTSSKKIVLPINKTEKGYYVGVNEDYITKEQIALKVPDGCDVYFGDTLLDKRTRDDDGYYILSEFLATDTKTVILKSAVESRKLLLILKEPDEMPAIETDTIIVKAEKDTHNGLTSYVYNWEVSRETVNSSINYVTEVMDVLFQDIMNCTDFYESEVYQMLDTSVGNGEQIKPEYLKLTNYFVNTNTKTYSALTCVDVSAVDADTLRRKQQSNVMLNNDLMQVYVNIDYSYLSNSTITGVTSPHTGTVTGYICLTKRDGVWKLCSIDEKILKNIR